ANFRSSNSSSGWSARGGQCRNPYALDRSPCGSSSGTAAGIAANFAAVGVGTETDGSIVCPSSACSLVGIKPTLGLVSRSGIVPIAHSQDTAGPMARTVSDAAILLGALAGADARDAATAAAPPSVPDYTRFLAEFAPGAAVKKVQDVIDFNERNRDREMPYFGQDLLVKAQEKGPLTDQAYHDALDKCGKLGGEEGLKAVLQQHKLDAVVAPTGNPAWPIDFIDGDHFLGGSSTPAAVAGFPHVTVPAGYVLGLPVGLSFIGA